MSVIGEDVSAKMVDALNEKISSMDYAMFFTKEANRVFDENVRTAIMQLEQGRTLYALESLKKIYIEMEKLTVKFREGLHERK